MKKYVIPLFLCVVIIFSLCGCNFVFGEKPAVSEPVASAIEATPVPDYEQPVDYIWIPNVLSDVYVELYGDAFIADYNAMIDAFLNYEGTFACSSAENAEAINTVSSSCFPLLDMDVGYIEYDETQRSESLPMLGPKRNTWRG